MPKIKNIWTIATVGVGALMLFGFKKKNDITQVVDNLSFDLADISAIQLSWPNLKFKAKFAITNNTDIPFGANLSSKIAITKVRVYAESGVSLGEAAVNLYQIDLPANTTIELPWMDMLVDAQRTLAELGGNAMTYINGDFSSLQYEIDITVFGKTITINA